jgi:predicted HicB family RNase H-like nuclease
MYIHVVKYRSLPPASNGPMSKTKVLNVRIDPELKKKAKRLAEADGRSLSNWVTKLISSKVKEAENGRSKEGSSAD